MGGLAKRRWAAGLVLGLLLAGCQPKSGTVVITNETPESLEVALLAPGVVEPFPPIQPVSGGSVTFTFHLAPEELPAALIWKAGDYERQIPISGSSESKQTLRVRILPGKKLVRTRPQEHVIDSHVLSALDYLQRIRSAWRSPGAGTNQAAAGYWQRALDAAGRARSSVAALAKGLGKDKDASVRHAETVVHNLVLTIADGFVRVGERCETGTRTTGKDVLKAACYYVKADRLGCYRARAKRRDLERAAKGEFERIFKAHLTHDAVARLNREPPPGFTHKFTSVHCGSRSLHYRIEYKEVFYREGNRHVRTKARSGEVQYAEDLIAGRYISLGGLALKAESYRSWPKELAQLWRAIGVLADVRKPENELR